MFDECVHIVAKCMDKWYRILVQNYTDSWKKLVVFFALHKDTRRHAYRYTFARQMHVHTSTHARHTMHPQVANLSEVLCHPLELVHCLLQSLHEDPSPSPCMATSEGRGHVPVT